MTLANALSHFRIEKSHDNRYQAYCPAHEDKNASLSILTTPDKMLLFCHAGCSVDEVLKAAKLTYADLFADAKPPVAIYQYRDENGELVCEKLKWRTAKGKTFRQRRIDEAGNVVDNLDGVRHIPYNLPKLLEVIRQGAPVLYVEGEKDAETARMLGYTATTMGGASDWKDEYKAFFKGAVLVQVPDKDEAGLKHADKVTKSLTGVCKSLRVAILPTGKDLTEWVEAGNSDLKPILAAAPELVTYKGLADPIVTRTISGYSFSWPALDLTVLVNRLTDDNKGIIVVKDSATGRTLVNPSDINLLSTRSLSELANRLSKARSVNWADMLSMIATRCYDALQDGGDTVNIDAEPRSMELKYLWYPIIPAGEPVTIFTAGGVGKSIFADYCAINVAYGLCANHGLPFRAVKANVLYLDWEADEETHKRYITAIKRGLNLHNEVNRIYYRHVEHPLAQIIDSVRIECIKLNIGLVILDSQMAATSGGTRGMTEAQIAGEYYNLLRSLNCATLTIDHVTKQSMGAENGAEAPYGSVVKYNRSRSQFELRLPEEDIDDDHKEFALIHRKFNLGRKQKPIGLSCDFHNIDNELDLIEYKSCSLADSPSLSTTLPVPQRLCSELQKNGPLSRADLKKRMGKVSDGTFGNALFRLIAAKKIIILPGACYDVPHGNEIP